MVQRSRERVNWKQRVGEFQKAEGEVGKKRCEEVGVGRRSRRLSDEEWERACTAFDQSLTASGASPAAIAAFPFSLRSLGAPSEATADAAAVASEAGDPTPEKTLAIVALIEAASPLFGFSPLAPWAA
jgi:hypothetical protein